jgi:hypothetical protein
MAKYLNPLVHDAGFDAIKNSGNLKQVLCSAQPTTYAEANATFKLAEVVLAPADFTYAAGDVSGRKSTVAAKNAVPVTVTGTGNHVAIIDTVLTRLWQVTTCTAQGVSSGGTVDIGSYKYEQQDPT